MQALRYPIRLVLTRLVSGLREVVCQMQIQDTRLVLDTRRHGGQNDDLGKVERRGQEACVEE